MRSRGAALLATLDDTIEYAPDPVEAYNALVSHAFGAAGDEYEARGEEQLEAKRLELRAAIEGCSMSAANVCAANVAAAAATKVEVRTKAGTTYFIDVPKGGRRALDASVHADQWYAADKKAFEAVLRLAGNELVPLEELKRMGMHMLEFVTSRRVKLDRSTGELAESNGFKSRHSIDEAKERRTGGAEAQTKLDARATYTIPVGEMETKIFIALVQPEDVLITADWVNGYGIGEGHKRPKRAVKLPETVEDEYRGPQGELMGLLMASSCWGEGVAGFEFEVVRDADLAAAGWAPCTPVAASWWQGNDRAIGIIDDILFRCRDKPDAALRTIEILSERAVARGGAPLTMQLDPTAFGGMRIARSPCRTAITISLDSHWEQAVRKWLPELLDGGKLRASVPQGKALRDRLDSLQLMPDEGRKLTREQREVPQIVGDLRWLLRTSIRLIKPVHMLSCVAGRPQVPATMEAALGVLADGWLTGDNCITYSTAPADIALKGTLKGSMDSSRGEAIAIIDGGERAAKGAPKLLDGTSDASWSLGPRGDLDVYAWALTLGGGSVAERLCKLHLVLGSSTETEGVGQLKLSDSVLYARDCTAAYGYPQPGPTMIASDSEPSLRIANGQATAARTKHALRRYAIIQQRVFGRHVRLGYLEDAYNWVDFMTKWMDLKKVEMSVAYLSGKMARMLYFGGKEPKPAA